MTGLSATCLRRVVSATPLALGLFAGVLAATLSNVAFSQQSPPTAKTQLTVYPESIELNDPRDSVQLIVLAKTADGQTRDVTREAELSLADDSVASVAEARFRPLAAGATSVKVKLGDVERDVPLSVSNFDKPRPISFVNGALVALSKQGCNSGACHGSPSGKGGFRLSLRAFDAKLDELTLIREDYGRRTNPLDAENSLLLMKPLMRLPHGGGVKLRKSDAAYSVLKDWIAEGCRPDSADTPRCVGIEVSPPSGRVLRFPAKRQQLRVVARFSDGSSRDVTPLAVYSSSDTAVAEVDVNGLVTGVERGEAAIVVRYLEHIEAVFLTFVRDIEGYAWNNPPANNYIDKLVHEKLRQLQYLPSDLCTDDEFLRRVFLDVTGQLPTLAETNAFLNDPAADKRARLIDNLLERPEYAKFWTLKWGDLLRLTKGQVGADGVHKYHRWVERAVRDNMPYDRFAHQLLTASGSTFENPPANFFRTSKEATDTVETVSQVFLGARLQCAKCHNHPFERWTQDNYYGMAAFFNRVQRGQAERPDEMFIFSGASGEVVQPRTGQRMKPWLPGKGSLEKADPRDRRITFADWLTSADNPYFAKIEVNRIWSHLLGRGIVDPPDDFRESNPPANAALLDALAADFVAQGFDRKHIIRTILNSRTYQASFRPNEFNESDTKYFSHYQPRLLQAEQLLDAICHVTSVDESFASLPPGSKATQAPAPDLINHEFLKIFGQPERQTVCDCERSNDSNLGMAIQFFNGKLIHNKVRDANNRFRRLMKADAKDPEIIRQLHLAAVCRPPTDKELQAALAHVERKQVEIIAENQRIDTAIAEQNAVAAKIRQTIRETLVRGKLKPIPEPLRDDLLAALGLEEAKRSEVQKYLVAKLGGLVAVTDAEITAALNDEQKKAIADSTARAAELAKSKTPVDSSRLIALEDICWALLNTNEFLFNH